MQSETKYLRILVACEESQRVCTEFRNLGHEAYSCDLIPCSGGHSEWHIQSDVLPLLNGNCEFETVDGTKHKIDDEWDIIVAHPPCFDLCVSGAAWFERKRENGSQRNSIEFFCKFLNVNCEHVLIENPIGIISGEYISKWFPDLCEQYNLPLAPTQIIQPWMFGDNFNKSTCLWLKGLPPLKPLVTEEPELEWFTWIDSRTGKEKRQPKWYAEAFKLPPKERSKVRSKTFPGIAKAIAQQYSEYVMEEFKNGIKN